MRHLAVLAVCVGLCAAAGDGLAAFEFDFGEFDEKVTATISGQPGEKGDLYLVVECGKAAVNAVEIFSEPSHTSLVFFASLAYSESEAGKAWQAGWEVNPPQAFFEFADLTVGRLEGKFSWPEGDDGFAVWVNSPWSDGKQESRLVSDAVVGSGSFGFATAAEVDPVLKYQHCCGKEEYGEMCISCESAEFTCSPVPAC